MRPQNTKARKPPVRSSEYNEHGFPTSVYVRGALCGFQFMAPITGDALYIGTNTKGETIHALVTNLLAHEHQATFFNRGG